MLVDKLKAYAASGTYPMHMPGHKRNTEKLPIGLPYDIDISEINGFDNLQDPRGILRETAEIAADIYGSDRAMLLVNGSTAGILAAIGALTGAGDKILMARNSHLSVYNAVDLFGLKPTYILPDTDETTGIFCSIDPASVKSVLELNRDIKLVVVTSPTYEGVVSDISSIAAIAHSLGIPLLVDEAHGAHLGFSGGFPENAVRLGADVVVMSLHKTLPALTQCSLLHVCGKSVDSDKIARLLSILQTSSPSYVLMASIDGCLRLLKSDSVRLFDEYERNLDRFDRGACRLKNLSVLCKGQDVPHDGFFMFDPGKIVVTTKKNAINGFALADALRVDHKIELEMACDGYALAMTGVCDTAEGFNRLSGAIAEIDRSVRMAEKEEPAYYPPMPTQAATPGSALKRHGRFVHLDEAAGLISLEYVWAYPPGNPVIVPGEIISVEILAFVRRMVFSGVAPKSTHGKLPEYIYACDK